MNLPSFYRWLRLRALFALEDRAVGRGRTVSRVLFPRVTPGAVTIYLGRRSPGASSDRYPRARRATLLRPGGWPGWGIALLFGLAPSGVYLAGRSPDRRWALAPPFHPCRLLPAVSFLWHFPSGHPDWALPSALLSGARTFLPAPRRGRSGHLSASTHAGCYPVRRS